MEIVVADDHDAGKEGREGRADEKPGDELPACAGPERREGKKRDTTVQAPSLPGRREDVRAKQQDDQLVGIRGQDVAHAHEAKDGGERQRQQSGNGEVDGASKPPHPHPEEEAEAAPRGVRWTGDRRPREGAEKKRAGEQGERARASERRGHADVRLHEATGDAAPARA